MSLTIIKAGILDTVQDTGRYGYQSSGINPTGAMDRFSAQLSNCLLGKEMNAPVIEMHFPASVIRFNKATVICVCGADFTPVINKKKISLNQPVVVNKGALLEFIKAASGARCYVSILQHLDLQEWSGSYSTNLKAEAGGFMGRSFKTGDVLEFEEIEHLLDYLKAAIVKALPFKAIPSDETSTTTIDFIKGAEWDWLTPESQQLFIDSSFTISTVADRIGYRLKGIELQMQEQKQLISSGVTFGTVQLLPNKQVIVLMADHQTTGGYPRIANVISAHLPTLAQMKPGDKIRFSMSDSTTAERKFLQQHQYLLSVQHASSFKIDNLFS